MKSIIFSILLFALLIVGCDCPWMKSEVTYYKVTVSCSVPITGAIFASRYTGYSHGYGFTSEQIWEATFDNQYRWTQLKIYVEKDVPDTISIIRANFFAIYGNGTEEFLGPVVFTDAVVEYVFLL